MMFIVKNNDPIRSQLWCLLWKIMIQSGHNYAHAMTAELSWHVQNCDLLGSIELKSEQKEFSRNSNYHLMNCLWNGPEVIMRHGIVYFRLKGPRLNIKKSFLSHFRSVIHYGDKTVNCKVFISLPWGFKSYTSKLISSLYQIGPLIFMHLFNNWKWFEA